MPYEGEFAGYKPLMRIASSERVQEVVSRCKRRRPEESHLRDSSLLAQIKPSSWLPDLVLAVDGSYHQLPVENGYPGAELAYVTVASVFINVKMQRELDQRRPFDPAASAISEQADSLDCVLPGCNVAVDEPTPKASFRRLFFEESARVRLASDGESLLETFESLLLFKPTARAQRCPYDDCPVAAEYSPKPGCSTCECELKRPWFSTDALRIHEGLNPVGPSGAMFAEAMQVWERVWVVNFLRWIELKGLFRSLRRIAIMLDGPLAVFGHPAWLSHAIYHELGRLNSAARKVTGEDLLLLGVEKSGAFTDHFDLLDTPTSRTQGEVRFDNQTAFLLTNSYIRENIALGEKTFGEDTYFGRKFFYKTSSGARIVASVPFLTEEDRDLESGDPRHFPRLADAMSLLDATFSARYPSAVAPLVSAHAEAAIPLNLGRQVLEQLARQLMVEDPPG